MGAQKVLNEKQLKNNILGRVFETCLKRVKTIDKQLCLQTLWIERPCKQDVILTKSTQIIPQRHKHNTQKSPTISCSMTQQITNITPQPSIVAPSRIKNIEHAFQEGLKNTQQKIHHKRTNIACSKQLPKFTNYAKGERGSNSLPGAPRASATKIIYVKNNCYTC